MNRREQIVGLLKDWGIAAAVTVVVVGLWRMTQPDPIHPGLDAPILTTPYVDGRPYDLAAESADVVVVNFWATWCGPCRMEIPDFSAFATANPDVKMLGISIDDSMQPPQLARAAKALGITYDVLHDADGRARATWGVDNFPTTFVLDSRHDVVDSHIGVASRQWLEQAVAKARAR